jgi:hypothetical protein
MLTNKSSVDIRLMLATVPSQPLTGSVWSFCRHLSLTFHTFVRSIYQSIVTPSFLFPEITMPTAHLVSAIISSFHLGHIYLTVFSHFLSLMEIPCSQRNISIFVFTGTV